MKRPSSFCCSNRENAWTTRQKRMRFSGIEHNLDELLDHTSNAEEKILAMNFAIWALGCELSAEANAAILHQGLLKTKDFRDYNLSSWLPEKEECLLEVREIELRNVNVCAIPYHGDKLVWALRDVSRDGFKEILATARDFLSRVAVGDDLQRPPSYNSRACSRRQLSGSADCFFPGAVL